MKNSTLSREEILEGNPISVMLKLGWPIMIGAVLDTLYHLADTFWLGHLAKGNSGDAVVGLQVAFPFIWFFVSFAFGMAMAGVAFVSQYTGANKAEKANHAATQVMSFALVWGLVIGVLGYFLVSDLIPYVTKIPEVALNATDYLRISFLGFPCLFITGAFRALMSASGNTKIPMYVAIVTNLLNLILDPFLILGIGPFPELGVIGAALATLFSMIVGAVIAVTLMLKGTGTLKMVLKDLMPSFFWYKRIVKVGLPAALGHSMEAFGFIVLMTIIGLLPNARDALGGYGIGERLIGLVTIAEMGLAQGLTTIIGQSLGAGRINHAKLTLKKGLVLIFSTVLLPILAVIAFREPLFALFIPEEPTIIAEGCRFMVYFGLSVPLFAIVLVSSSAFNAAGRNIPPMIVGVCRLWCFRVPLTYLLGVYLGFGSLGVWIGMSISNVAAALISLAFLAGGSWQKAIIED